MNRQDGAAKQAAPRWDIGSVAANATLDYLNQSGVSTKYTQDIAQAAPKQTAPKQSASGWNLKSVAADATLDYLNQNGVSTKYTQDIARTVPKQPQTTQMQTAQYQAAPAQDTWNTRQTNPETRKLGLKERQMERSAAVTPPRPVEQIESELRAVRDRIGRIESSRSNAMPVIEAQAEQKKQLLRQKERLERELTAQGLPIPEDQSTWDRMKGAVAGAAEKWYSGQLSATGGLAGNTDTIGRNMAEEDYERALQYRQSLQYELEDYEAGEIQMTDRQLQNIRDQIKYYDEQLLPALKKGVEAYDEIGEQSAAEADRLSAEAEKKIATAKEDLGLGGQIAVDVLVQGTQMALDRATGAPRLSMFNRMFGYGTQEARQNGADWEDQVKYGAAVATVEVLTEKAFDGLAGLYGAGAADDLVDKWILKLATSDEGQKALKIVFGATGEGMEEIISDALNPMLRMLYSDRSLVEEYSEENIIDWLYDGFIGSIMGTGGTSIEVARGWNPQVDTRADGQNAGKNAENANTPGAQTPGTVSPSLQEAAEPRRTDGPEAVLVVDRLRENIPDLSQMNTVAETSSDAVLSIPGNTMAEKARVLFERIKGTVTRPGLGVVEINNRSVRDDLSHGVGMAKAAVIPAIPEVIQSGRQIDFQEQWKGRPYDGYIFAAPVNLDGRTVYVAAIVKQTSKNRFYLHEVVDSDGNFIKLNGGEKANPTSLASVDSAGAFSPPGSSMPIGTGGEAVASPNNSIPNQSRKVNENLSAETGANTPPNAKALPANHQPLNSLTQIQSNSIIKPYLDAYNNYLNSVRSGTQENQKPPAYKRLSSRQKAQVTEAVSAALDQTNVGELFNLYWDYEKRSAIAEKLYSDYAEGPDVFGKWEGKLGDARALAAQFDRIAAFGPAQRLSLEERTGQTPAAQSEKQAENNADSEIITDGSHIKDGKLKPNVTYTTGEYNYVYKTNEDGLIVHVHAAQLFFKKHVGRLQNVKNTLGKLVGDHAGHLIADLFGGSPKLDNLVSQARRVNLSEYKKIENKWAKALKRGETVSVDISIEYEQGNPRPIGFIIEYTINGVGYRKEISQ